jgi:hypothetical protein
LPRKIVTAIAATVIAIIIIYGNTDGLLPFLNEGTFSFEVFNVPVGFACDPLFFYHP